MVQPGDLTPCSGKFCFFLSVVNVAFSVTIVLENFIVLAALYRISKKKSWKVPNILMASLATTDFLSGLISQSLYGYFLWIQADGFSDKEVKGANIWLLLILNYSSYTLCGASLLIVALMSVDRLVAIVSPLKYRERSYKTISCTSLAMAANFCLIVPLLRFTSASTVPVFTATIMIVIIAALIVTVISYVIIFYKYKNSRFAEKPNGNVSKQAICRQRRLTKSFIIIGVTLIAMYLPQLILKPFILSQNSTIKNLDVSLEDIANTILYCNHFVNPLIFAFRHGEVRRAIEVMFDCCMRLEPKRRRNTASVSVSSDKSSKIHESYSL